jgi:SRSO17 transposase
LPQEWANDLNRRRDAHVPESVVFQTKPEIALGQIKRALAEGVPKGVVLADAGYGDDTNFRDELTGLALPYVVGIKSGTTVWPEGTGPLPPRAYSGRGARPHRLRRDPKHQPVSVRDLAMGIPDSQFKMVSWREGTAGPLRSRFCTLRVRPAHHDTGRDTARDEEWLLVEWPDGEREPTKYFLSTLPARTPLRTLVRIGKLRWRIERDYEELKGELGLNHYEGRGWTGFHHHATLCIAAYAFLAAERGLFPPGRPRGLVRLKAAALPKSFRPRGSPAPDRAPQSSLNRHIAATDRRAPHQSPTKMSHLPPQKQPTRKSRKTKSRFMTQ